MGLPDRERHQPGDGEDRCKVEQDQPQDPSAGQGRLPIKA
jgi:hypothetical protein